MFSGVKFSEKCNGNSFKYKKKQFFNSEKTKVETTFYKFLKSEILSGANSH